MPACSRTVAAHRAPFTPSKQPWVQSGPTSGYPCEDFPERPLRRRETVAADGRRVDKFQPDELTAGTHAQFRERAPEVERNGARGDPQLGGDVFVRQALSDKLCYLQLHRGERRQRRRI